MVLSFGKPTAIKSRFRKSCGGISMAEMAENNWKELAEAACNETDSEKLMGLVEQLNRALEEHMKDHYQSPNEIN
jgi:hypothetical protein